jgi:hypothetical protein
MGVVGTVPTLEVCALRALAGAAYDRAERACDRLDAQWLRGAGHRTEDSTTPISLEARRTSYTRRAHR